MNASINDLIGKTLISVTGKVGDDEIIFRTDTETYRLFHDQDCCESVAVEDICGDLSCLVGSPILQAEESSSDTNPPGFTPPSYGQGSFTWTFYRIATMKGQVVIRWYGESNGYYSERVDFEKLQ